MQNKTNKSKWREKTEGSRILLFYEYGQHHKYNAVYKQISFECTQKSAFGTVKCCFGY